MDVKSASRQLVGTLNGRGVFGHLVHTRGSFIYHRLTVFSKMPISDRV
jgi:hypothetical protein